MDDVNGRLLAFLDYVAGKPSDDEYVRSYYSQPNRALAARLRTITYGLRWVLPIAEGDL